MFSGQNRASCADLGLGLEGAPRPAIAKPQLRQQVQFSRLGTAIVNGYLHQDVVGGSLEILNENVPIAIFIENPGIDQFELVVLQGRGCDSRLTSRS